MIAVAVLSGTATAAPPAETRFEKVEALGLDRISGTTPTWYVEGGKARGAYLRSILEHERRFFRRHTGDDIQVSLAVLDASRWMKVEPDLPYGLPSISDPPRMALMPINWAEVNFLPMPDPDHADAGLLASARRAHLSWRRIIDIGADLIIAHEFGHALAATMGIDTEVSWFNELIAGYALYAYTKGGRQDLVTPLELFYAYTETLPHRHSSLRYLDGHYTDILSNEPMNYGWYQGQLFARIEEVYRHEGVEFLNEIRTDIKAKGKYTENTIFERLETLGPGWKAWSRSLEESHRVGR